MFKKIPLNVEILRANLGCREKDSHINVFEFLFFIFGCHIKQFIELILSTFHNTSSIGSFIGSPFPLNIELFWVLTLKVLLGFTTIGYFFIKYKNKAVIRNVTIYWLFSVGNDLAASYARFEIMPIWLADLTTMSVYMLLFCYAFAWDPHNLDCLWMIMYEGLEIDETTGRVYKTPWTKFSVKKLEKLIFWIGVIVAISIASVTVIVNLINYIIKLISNAGANGTVASSETKNQKRINDLLKINILWVLISSLVIAPITEELVFRKCLMQLGKYKWLSVFISAFVFGMIHLSRESIIKMIPYSIYGFVFAVIMWATKNMWPGVICHASFNLIATIYILFFRSK